MKRNIIVIGIIVIIVIIAIIFFLNHRISPNTSNEAEPFSETNPSSNENDDSAENRIANILQNANEILPNIASENEISSFSTQIKDQEAGRLTNINLTCSILNNTIIRKGETFSFNEIVGEPTTERGYQEASVIIDQKTQRGIGGRKLPS